MKIPKIMLWSASLFLASAAHAGFQQTVQLCVQVENNTSPYTFRTLIQSTDLFDRGQWSGTLSNGKRCQTRIYSKGPKTLDIGVGATNGQDKIKINVDTATCKNMFNSQLGWVETDYQDTTKPNINWEFKITQAPASPEYDYTFNLVCSYTESE